MSKKIYNLIFCYFLLLGNCPIYIIYYIQPPRSKGDWCLASRKVLWVNFKMAEKKEEFEMNNFSSSLQYFENRIRFTLSESLTYSDSHFLHSKRNLCKFGALLKSKSSRTSKKPGDLIVNLKDTKTQVFVEYLNCL